LSQKLVPAATRTIAILRLLAKSHQPMSLRDIAAELDLVPSTCLNILRVLVDESLVVFDPATKRYKLGMGVLSLARSILSRDMLLDFFRQEIESISIKFGTTAVATRVEFGRAITMAVTVPTRGFSINIEVGSRYPAYMGTTGRCLAAHGGNPDQIYERLTKGRWDNMPDKKTWLEEVAMCRTLGYTVDRGNLNAGITVVAAPVFSNEGVLTHTIGTLSITAMTEPEMIAARGEALLDIGRRAKLAQPAFLHPIPASSAAFRNSSG
jgi:DNA-binding IclR family transcriptional regulator